mmetsp:Transcript_12151/g.24217  ORF Transcript_12151/g.24217 Transcript_12151/m.24217 type:complete len:201 (+) Transcript_12151:1248-1850(+)
MRKVRPVDHQLLWNTSHVHTRPTEPAKASLCAVSPHRRLGKGHLGAMPRSNARGAHPTAASSDDKVIVVESVLHLCARRPGHLPRASAEVDAAGDGMEQVGLGERIDRVGVLQLEQRARVAHECGINGSSELRVLRNQPGVKVLNVPNTRCQPLQTALRSRDWPLTRRKSTCHSRRSQEKRAAHLSLAPAMHGKGTHRLR